MSNGVVEEIRTSNLLISLGYFVRPHVQVFPDESTTQLTDIDVFATKFDSTIGQTILLVECKQGSQRFADLFKLFGFKTYFGNCEAMFITDNVSAEFRETSGKLGIRAISFRKLGSIVKQSGDSVNEKYTEDDITNIEVFLREIRDSGEKELFWRYNYLWLERDPFRRFYQLQRLFKLSTKTGGGGIVSTPSLAWYRKEVFILSLLCVTEMASECANVDDKFLASHIESRFYDLGTPKEGKEKIRAGVNALVKQIESLSGENMEFKGLDLVPRYIDALVAIVKKFLGHPKYVQNTLLLNDRIFRGDLHAKPLNIQKLANSEAQYREVKSINEGLLRILFEGPISPDFNNFV